MHLSSALPAILFGKRTILLLLFALLIKTADAQVIYQGGSNVQFLYGRSLGESGELATITLEHFGSYSAFEHFGFTDLFNDASLASPNMYLEWYPKASLSRATGKEIKLGPISDVLMGGGVNVLFGGTEDFFVYLAGPVFKFNVPGSGLLQLEVYYYKQYGEAFGGTYQFTPSWDLPFTVTEKLRLRFRGFMDFIGDRGPGGRQFLTQPQLFFDLGHTWGKTGKIYLGSEWRYWNNVAGIEGLEESILQANLLLSL